MVKCIIDVYKEGSHTLRVNFVLLIYTLVSSGFLTFFLTYDRFGTYFSFSFFFFPSK